MEKFHDTDSHAFEPISQMLVKGWKASHKFLSSRSVAEKIQNLGSDFIGCRKSKFCWLDEIAVMEKNMIKEGFLVEDHFGTFGAEESAVHRDEFRIRDFQLEKRNKSRFRN